MDKFEARKKYRSLRDKLSEEDLLDSSVKIANNCLSLDIWEFHNYHIFLSIEKILASSSSIRLFVGIPNLISVFDTR